MSQELEYHSSPGDRYRELSPMSDASDRTERPRRYEPSSPLTPPETPRSRHLELTDDDDDDSSASSPFPVTPRTPAQPGGAQRRAALKALQITPSSSRSTASSSSVPAEAYAEYFKILASRDRAQFARAQEIGYGLFPASTPPNTPLSTPHSARVVVSGRRPPASRHARSGAALHQRGGEEGDASESSSDSESDEEEIVAGESPYMRHSSWQRNQIPFPRAESIEEQEEHADDDPVLRNAIRESPAARPPDRDSSPCASSCDTRYGEREGAGAVADEEPALDASEGAPWSSAAVAQGGGEDAPAFARPRRMKRSLRL